MKTRCAILFVILLFPVAAFSQVEGQGPTELFNDNYITIYLTGYWSKCAADLATPITYRDVFMTRFENTVENDPAGYFSKSQKKLNQLYYNVFSYSFSNGWAKNEFRINGQLPASMADVMIREIGDFNVGSQVIHNGNYGFDAFKQCLIGLAKTEWVFMKYIVGNGLTECTPDWDPAVYQGQLSNPGSSIAIHSRTANYEKLVLSIGPFVSLLSPEYLRRKIENDGTLKTLLDPQNRKSAAQIAEELALLAWRCPNRINFVCHSQGGMYLFRYLNGRAADENLYGYNSDRVNESLYHFYQNYTRAKFEDEKRYYDDPSFFRGYEMLSRLNPLTPSTTAALSSFTDRLKALDYAYWNRKIADNFPGESLETIGPEDADIVLFLMFVKERENAVHRVATEDSPLLGSNCPGFWTNVIKIFGDAQASGKFITEISACFLANLVIESVSSAGYFYSLGLGGGGASPNFWEDFFVIKPHVMLIDGLVCIFMPFIPLIVSDVLVPLQHFGLLYRGLHNFFSSTASQFEELYPSSALVNSYRGVREAPDQRPFSGEPVKIFTTSYAGTPTIRGDLDLSATYLNVTMGHTQRILVRAGYLALYKLIGQEISKANGYSSPEVSNSEHLLPGLLESILGALYFKNPTDRNGSLLVPTESSRGTDIAWLSSTNYHLNKTSDSLVTLKNMFDDASTGGVGNPFEYDRWNNSLATEVLGVHGWNQHILAYKIFMIKSGLVFFEDSPYKNAMSITDKSGRHTGALADLPFANDPRRTLYAHMFLEQPVGLATLNNICIPEDNLYGNQYTPEFALQPLNTGLECNFIPSRSYENKSLNVLTTTSYLNVLPLILYNYYDGMRTLYSINGSAFTAGARVADIDAYARSHLRDALPSLVFDDHGRANIVNPRFKEGYNTVTFKMIDFFGRERVKSVVVSQNVVPPFIKPIYPLMNQTIGSPDITISLQAFDLTRARPVERWFRASACTLLLDGTPVPLSAANLDRESFTINVPVRGLASGNHELTFRVNDLGSVNERSFRFWVDVTPPDIQFGPPILFSNADPATLKSFGALVSDTVPFTERFGTETATFPVDTITLGNVTIQIDGSVELANETDTRLGDHWRAWNGWDNGLPLNHGSHTLNVSATDRMGNTASRSQPFIIDNRAPEIRNASFNTTLVNTQAGALELTYSLGLDEWEEQGTLRATFHNRSTNETFSLENVTAGGEDVNFAIAYASEGADVLKDGVYDVSLTALDHCGNESAPVTFANVIVDMHRPVVSEAYATPLIVSGGASAVAVTLTAAELDPAPENLSGALPLTLTFADQYGAPIGEVNAVAGSLVPGVRSQFPFTIPPSLPAGKYVFQARVRDKNDNVREEVIPIIKDALSPEITYPADLQIVDADISLRGAAGDPRWDNTLPFDHYELYYRYGEPAAISDLAHPGPEWLTDRIQTPAYQRKSAANAGYYPVESDGVLGFLSIDGLPNGYLTLLLIVVEEGGYRIATMRTVMIMAGGSGAAVDLVMDPAYAGATVPVDFSRGDVSIAYTVHNAVDNPVDVFMHLKDADGAIVRETALYNMRSLALNGQPALGAEDTGVFVWDESGTVHVTLKNGAAQTSYLVTISTEGRFDGLTAEGAGSLPSYFLNLVEDGKRIVCSQVLAAGETCAFSFTAPAGGGMTFSALAGGAFAPLHLGADKTVVPGGQTVLYQGADYPPFRWDGKDAWDRYVADGTYTLSLEAVGTRGGYDRETTTLAVTTPLVVAVTQALPADKKIQPGLPEVGGYTVSASVNKTAWCAVEILDAAGSVVRALPPSPAAVTERGIITFTWNGDADGGAFCPRGLYRIRLLVTTVDTIVHEVTGIPEFESIEITDIYHLDASVPATLLPLSEEKFQGRDLCAGDTSYAVAVEPRGRYVPDKEARLTLDAKGTQAVAAAPDLDYMAAIRVNYGELDAEISYRGNVRLELDLEARSSLDSKSIGFSSGQSTATYVETDIKLASYSVETETMNRFVKTITFVFEGRESFPYPPPIPLPEWVPPWWWPILVPCAFEVKSKRIIPSVSVSILKGKAYTITNSSYTVNRFDHAISPPEVSLRFTVTYTIQVMTKPETGPEPPGTFSVKNYLSYCDALAAVSPDIKDDPSCPYAHHTPFVFKNMAALPSVPLLDGADLYASTNLPNDPGHANNPQDITEVWRKDRRLFFYAIGEAGVPVPVNLGLPAGVSQAPPPFVTGTINDPINSLLDGESRDYRNGDVTFRLDRAGSVYSVAVSAAPEASTTILYPYPTAADPATPHIISDPVLGIARTSINGVRVNGADFTPNYHVDPSAILQGNDTLRTFAADFTYAEGAYSGLFPWSDVTAAYASPVINFKHYAIVAANAFNKGTAADPQGVLERTDLGLPEAFPVNADLPVTFTPTLADPRFAWHLALDPLIGDDVLRGRPREPLLDDLNRYGIIKRCFVSDYYPSAGETADTSLFLIEEDTGTRRDNNRVLVRPDTGGRYNVSLTGADGLPFRGLTTGAVNYGEDKLMDRFDILLTPESPRTLVAIHGTAPAPGENASYMLSYYDQAQNRWTAIPVSQPDPTRTTLGFWDVSRLPAGLYTVRLLSRVTEGETVRVNAADRQVYIGQAYRTAVPGDQSFASAFGNATLIFPDGLFAEDTLVDVKPVEPTEITDIAVLPDFAPVGKVIRLTPEGMTFSAPVQLQFTFNRLQLLDVDPEVLKIYTITSSGELVALDTLKRYVRVLFDAAGAVVGEEEGTKDDFTYVRLWAQLRHFSYYTVLEGDAAVKPVLDQKDFTTNKTAASFSGTAAPHATVALSWDDDPVYREAREAPQVVAHSVCDEQGRFSFKDVPIPREGKNYFYFGTANAPASAVSKVTVTRDTTPPALTVEGGPFALSPNHDGRHDSCVIRVLSSEDALLRLVVKDARGEQVYDRSQPVIGNGRTPFELTALSTDGVPWSDGRYTLIVTGRDALDNLSVNDAALLTVDTTPARCRLTSLSPVISPANADGRCDTLDIGLDFDKACAYSLFLLNDQREKILALVDGQAPAPGAAPAAWDGRDADGAWIPDGTYFLSCRTVDGLGNETEDILEPSLAVDNTPPQLTFGSGTRPVFANSGTGVTYPLTTDEPAWVTMTVTRNGAVVHTAEYAAVTAGDCALSWDVPASLAGEFLVSFSATDQAYNTGVLQAGPLTVAQDNTAPVTEWTITGASCESTAGIVLARSSAVVLIPTDECSGIRTTMYALESVERVYAGPITFTGGGTYTVEYYSIDNAGNSEPKKSAVFIVDTTPPAITIRGVETGTTYRTSVTPEIEITDALPCLSEVRLDGAPFASGTPVDARGTHTLTVTSVDGVNNASEKTVMFAIDQRYVPPVREMDYYFTHAGRVRVVWQKPDCTDIRGYRCYLNGRPLGGFHRRAKHFIKKEYVDLGPLSAFHGRLQVEISALDARGNESARSKPLVIRTGHELTLLPPSWRRHASCDGHDLHLHGWAADTNALKVEYAFVEDGKTDLDWQQLYDGYSDHGYYHYIYRLPDEDRGKTIAWRVSAEINGHVFSAGCTLKLPSAERKKQ